MGNTPVAAIGGIRGLTAVSTPSMSISTPYSNTTQANAPATTQSLLLIWTNSSSNQGCMYRLDPNKDGGFTQLLEICLASLMTEYLKGTEVFYTLGAYNQALSVQDPATAQTVHLIGFLARIKCTTSPCVEKESPGKGTDAGYYSGATFFIRKSPSDYKLNEVGGRRGDDTAVPALVATRTYARSPFPSESKSGQHANAIYFGGYDCNEVLAPTNTAWAYRGELATVLSPLCC